MRKFANWLRTDKPQETPVVTGQFNFFRNLYDHEIGSWEEVEKVARWPEGRDVAQFLEELKALIAQHGRIPAFNARLKKLFGMVRRLNPEHGADHFNRANVFNRTSPRQPDVAANGNGTTGPYVPNGKGYVVNGEKTGPYQNQTPPNPAQTTEDDLRGRIAELERRLSQMTTILTRHGLV